MKREDHKADVWVWEVFADMGQSLRVTYGKYLARNSSAAVAQAAEEYRKPTSELYAVPVCRYRPNLGPASRPRYFRQKDRLRRQA